MKQARSRAVGVRGAGGACATPAEAAEASGAGGSASGGAGGAGGGGTVLRGGLPRLFPPGCCDALGAGAEG
eukprot:1139408-Pelagomonas_calceolata.AAC.4